MIGQYNRAFDCTIILTGGEPLTYDIDKLQEFIGELKQLNKEICVGLFTTGLVNKQTHITHIDEEKAKGLKEAGLDFCYTSIYHINNTVHDKITGIPGSYKNVMNAIDTLKKVGIDIKANVVLNKNNINDLEYIIDELKDKEISEVRLLRLIQHGRATDNWQEINISEEIQNIRAKEMKEKYGEYISLGGFIDIAPCQKGNLMCKAGKNKLYIDILGNIYPCGAVKHIDKLCMGNIYTKENAIKNIESSGCLCRIGRS